MTNMIPSEHHPMTEAQQAALSRLLDRFTSIPAARWYTLSQLLDRPVASLNDVSREQWNGLRVTAYPDWPQTDTLNPVFESNCRWLVDRWQKKART